MPSPVYVLFIKVTGNHDGRRRRCVTAGRNHGKLSGDVRFFVCDVDGVVGRILNSIQEQSTVLFRDFNPREIQLRRCIVFDRY